jgi:hypothetical protein
VTQLIKAYGEQASVKELAQSFGIHRDRHGRSALQTLTGERTDCVPRIFFTPSDPPGPTRQQPSNQRLHPQL